MIGAAVPVLKRDKAPAASPPQAVPAAARRARHAFFPARGERRPKEVGLRAIKPNSTGDLTIRVQSQRTKPMREPSVQRTILDGPRSITSRARARMAAIGASCPLPRPPATVPSPIPLQSFFAGGGRVSPCPTLAIDWPRRERLKWVDKSHPICRSVDASARCVPYGALGGDRQRHHLF